MTTNACIADLPGVTPSHADLMAVFDGKYRREAELGWGPKTRLSYGYFNPDDHYEAIVNKLVRPVTAWADVGCGRSSPTRALTWAQNFGPWFSSSRCAHSCAAT